MPYDFTTFIDRRGTYSTQWDFVQDRFGKANLLPFTISDMDFAIAPEIQQALEKHVTHGIFGYSRWNHADFKEAIALWFSKRFTTTIDPNTIAYSPSIIYSCAQFIDLYTQEGDGVVVQTPCYDAFIPLIEGRNRHLIANPLRFDGTTYHLDLIDLAEKLPRAKAILLCNPHNPTGIIFSPEELSQIVALARQHDVAIISDEAHMDLVFSPHQHTPICAVWGDYPKVVLATSTAKGFNLASLGGSYLLSNDPTIKERFNQQLKRDGLSSPPILAILATISAYHQAEAWLEALLTQLERNRALLNDFFTQHLPQLQLHPSVATYFAWIDISSLHLSSAEVQQRLINHGLAIMKGETYRQESPLFLRMNIACPPSKIHQSLIQMHQAFG
ncbi:MalY/PatB family protein [Entomospira culicis]|uniref:cysteine-S-conjugate beta-lyase n=1 Tax=Entomospira culicis TaxID=2719989 RepID=A0A968GE71_9SPIO|nr:PatB family C-S lyase [Entomospira culicis]NIZ18683.1 putative C-S lyase [Entomospira culicis]NIZ68898.1 putative C-S lyase [Entomospira culicis]WDI37491.1 PatB family C-S lyase [Entomospira culicis]WDI39119.1 PatB family C-S lyase [Entomospira culicis]